MEFQQHEESDRKDKGQNGHDYHHRRAEQFRHTLILIHVVATVWCCFVKSLSAEYNFALRAGEFMDRFRRIMVYGVTGSGKTTLARKIGEKTGLPWHSVDDLTWEPGWIAVPADEQRRRIQAICDRPEWVLDTAYGQWRDIPLASVELIVALDYPRWLSFFRLLRRSIQRAIDKRPICNGNIESFKLMLSHDSILFWHFKSFKSKRTRIAAWAAQSDGPKVLRFRRPKDADLWLRSLT